MREPPRENPMGYHSRLRRGLALLCQRPSLYEVHWGATPTGKPNGFTSPYKTAFVDDFFSLNSSTRDYF